MKKKAKKGFTLIEMLAAVAIFSVIAVALVSMVSSALKFNVANKTTFDANSNSRAFYESVRNNRPSTTRLYPQSGKYYSIYFDNQNELPTIINTVFNNTLIGYDAKKTFSDLKGGSGGKKYAIQVKVDKKEVINSSDATKKSAYYELTTQSYDLIRGEYTEIERKSIIAEE